MERAKKNNLEAVFAVRCKVLGSLTVGQVPGAKSLFTGMADEVPMATLYRVVAKRMNAREKAFFQALGLHFEGSSVQISAANEPETRSEPTIRVAFKASTRRHSATLVWWTEGTQPKNGLLTPKAWLTLRCLAEAQLDYPEKWVHMGYLVQLRDKKEGRRGSEEGFDKSAARSQGVRNCIVRVNGLVPQDQPLIIRDGCLVRICTELLDDKDPLHVLLAVPTPKT